jgi:hypothetical protein
MGGDDPGSAIEEIAIHFREYVNYFPRNLGSREPREAPVFSA